MNEYPDAPPSGEAVERMISLLEQAQTIADDLGVTEIGARLQEIIDYLSPGIGL